jgi:hypothetical protein
MFDPEKFQKIVQEVMYLEIKTIQNTREMPPRINDLMREFDGTIKAKRFEIEASPTLKNTENNTYDGSKNRSYVPSENLLARGKLA